MAYLDKVKLPDGITYDLQGIEYIVGTQTAATNAWTGVTRSAELYTGKAIIYKLPYAGTGTAATLNLTLSGGGTTGAKAVQRVNNSNITTHYPANSVLFLVYDGDRWRHDAEYDSTNIYQLRNNNGTYLTSAALYRYQILLQKNETTLIPVSNGNNSTATGKTITTTQFDPFGEIYYYNSTVTVAANAAIDATTLYQQMNLNMAYAFNTTNTLTRNKDVYLVATPTTAGKAKLHSTPTTQALPTSDNGLIYIRLGHASSTTNVEIHPAHPVFYHDGNRIKLWTGTKIPSKTSDLTNDSGFLTSAVTSVNGDTGDVTVVEGLEPLIGDVDEITPAQVRTAVIEGRDVCLSATGQLQGINLELEFTSFNCAKDVPASGAVINVVISQTIACYDGVYYLFELFGNVSAGWDILSTALAQFTDIPKNISDLNNDVNYITTSCASSLTPVMDGTATQGVSNLYARGDHVHPTDTTRASTATFSTSANGLVPKPASAATNSYLNSSGTWTIPPNTTYGTVTSAEAGLAPAGGSGTTKYLRQDGSWQVPPDNNATYTLTGTTSTSDYKVVLSGANAATATIPLATSARAGLVKPNGSSGYCLNGTGGWSAFNNFTHPTHTAATVGPTANTTLTNGGSFTVPQVTVNSSGHVSSITGRSIKLPTISVPNYDIYSATSNGLVPSYQSYLDDKFSSSFIVNGDIVLTADQNYYSAGWNRANDFIKVQGSGNQNLTSGSVTNITLSVDVFGTNPSWYGSLDTGVVIDTPGYYEVVGSAFLAPTTASGLCGVYIKLDSTEQGSQFGAVGDSSTPRAMMVGPIIVKVTESYQKLYLAARCSRKASDSSTVYGVVDRGHHSTFLQVKRIGPI